VEGLHIHYHDPDIEGVRAIYSALGAHFLPGPTVWPMLVGPPGSMKTDVLNTLSAPAKVHFVDQITPNTFISGQIQNGRKGPPPGLLHRIGASAIIVCADFSTLLSINRNVRASIFADLRRIYDGHLHKEFGTADSPQLREWRGRITFMAAVTEDIDRHHGAFQALGERFVMIRWNRPGGVDAALRAMKQDHAVAAGSLRYAAEQLMRSFPKGLDPEIPEEMYQKIAALGEFAVRGRTPIPRKGNSKTIVLIPQPESATRLPQQLCQLAKGSAMIGGRAVATEEDYRIARRAALDCIPAMRRKVLDVLIADGDVSDAHLPASTEQYVTEDLEVLGLLLPAKGLSFRAEELLHAAGVL